MSETLSSVKYTNRRVIGSYEDLLREEEGLIRQMHLQQEMVGERWASVKDKYAPAVKMISSVGKFTSGGGKGILATGLNIALGLLFKKTGAPVIRSMATGYVAEKAIGLLTGLFKRKKKVPELKQTIPE